MLSTFVFHVMYHVILSTVILCCVQFIFRAMYHVPRIFYSMSKLSFFLFQKYIVVRQFPKYTRSEKTRFMTVACAKLVCILKIVLRAMFVSTGTIQGVLYYALRRKNLLVLPKLLKITLNIINLIHCIYLWSYLKF